ncbi:hypothetical protein ILUMI_19966, partial [Ignelater luminosus]
LNDFAQKQIKLNREKLNSIVSTIIFCGTHDLPLHGKLNSGGNFADLLKFRIESGDKMLQSHLSESKSTEKYISVRIQNELINICVDKLYRSISKCKLFVILADKSADISGVKQMSLDIRYVDVITENVHEEFLGFVPLKQLNAESIANDIISFFSNSKLNLNKMVGQGYDGCSTMAGKDGGVQKIRNDMDPKVVYFHCTLHTLNVVIHDLNTVTDIRNTIGTVKNII